MLHKENAVIKAGVTQQTHGGSLYYVVEVPRNEHDDEYDKRRARYEIEAFTIWWRMISINFKM